MARTLLVCTVFLVVLSGSSAARADLKTYQEHKQSIQDRRAVLAKEWTGQRITAKEAEALASELVLSIDELADYWVGSDWGRGVPQSDTPQAGKTNCGTFVGALLRDLGFTVDIKKLQRLPSQGIILSFVKGKRVRKFGSASMEHFLASVKKMGPGLFIIGMDAHVGLLIQTETELRYMHSSSETGKVVKEPAAEAWTIRTSQYRVVGKILSPQNIRYWLRGRRISVGTK